MQNKDVYVVIMAGGIGSRFWPYSRNNHPKQFLDILGVGSSLLQMTYQRFAKVCPTENIYIVTNSDYDSLVKEQLPDIDDEQVLLEPQRRNTAPCIALSSYKILQKNPDAKIIVSPSDHAIFKDELFYNSLNDALVAVEDGDKLVTIGIKPHRPETGYGYIQYHTDEQSAIKKVKTFTEKPQLDLAQKFFESGEFVWNSGIFIWHVKAITKAFEEFLPEVSEIFQEGQKHFFTPKETPFIKNAYSQCKNISIDYAIMEKAANVYVVLGNFGWSDLGSWASLFEMREKDEDSNVIEANAITYDSHNCIIKGDDDKLIVVQDLHGYLIADCGNVLLICRKDNEEKFRDFVSDVKSKKGTEFL